MMTRKKKFYKEDLIETCRNIYKKHGVRAFLYKNMDKTLYFRLYQNGIKLQELIKILDIEKELNEYKISIPYEYGDKTRKRWSWKRIISDAEKVVEENNYLPPAGWFSQNGYKSLIQAIYNLGKTWEDLRDEFKDFENSSFVTSRNGMRWRSHLEASLSNFLYARGITHDRGKKYPNDYSEITGQTYGYYDLQFETRTKDWVDVEIWGDKPYGHNEKHYAFKRKLKENYNKKNSLFLGIEFNDCYIENKLIEILEPYIGYKPPSIFERNYDKIIPSTHWSNADELIEYCKIFVKNMPNETFPTEEWLRKRGKWKNRDGEAYNTLSIYIKKWIGGIRQLRKIIGQPENSTVKWNREKAIQEYKKIFDIYGLTTGQLRGKMRSSQIELTKEERFRINNIDAAVRKHFGSCYDLNLLLGIKNYRKKRY